jgi:hypothetical protein
MAPPGQQPLVWFGVANPKGESNADITAYLIEQQMKGLPSALVGKPVNISHHTAMPDGSVVPSGGTVLFSSIHPRTKECWVFFTALPNSMGKFITRATGADGVVGKEFQAGELSIGFEIVKQEGVPLYHKVNELSICYSGARPNCHIKGCIPLKDIIKPTNVPMDEHINNLLQVINNSKQSSANPAASVDTPSTLEEMSPKASASAGTPVVEAAAPVIPSRPANAVAYGDVFKNILSAPAVASPLGEPTSVIANASSGSVPAADAPPAQDVDASLAKALVESLVGGNAASSNKREREETMDDEPKYSSFNLQQYAQSTEEFSPIPAPEGLNPEQVAQWQAQQEQMRVLFNQNKATKVKEQRERMQKMEGVMQSILPTIVGQLPHADQEVPRWQSGLAAIMNSSEEVGDVMYKMMEAQASTLKKKKREVQDVNQANEQLKKENSEFKKQMQELVSRMTSLEEAAKNNKDKKPFLTTQAAINQQQMQQAPQQPVAMTANASSAVSAPANPYLTSLKGLDRVFAVAAMKAADPYDPTTRLSDHDNYLISTQMADMFRKYQLPNPEAARNRDVAGGLHQAVIAQGGKVDAAVLKKWENISDCI